MPTKLLIVESPGKVKKLSQILGSDWLVKASMGHVRELANDGIDSLGFELESGKVQCRFVPRGSRGKETIAQLKSAVQKVKTVFLATDDDREGETIAWHLQQALNLRQPQRVVYSEITPAAVKRAIANPRTINQNLVDAGLCRTVLDKLVGYKGSPLLWKLQNGAKSMGRVQSATLHILCDRERQIEAFVPQDYWSVFVDYAEGFRAFYHGSETTETDATPADDATPNGERTAPESTRVLSETEADRLVQQAQAFPHRVLSIEGKTINRTPPPPFVTSTLQQAAGSRLKFSPEKTMQVAQSLYEAGHITYMRTDSIELSPEYRSAARQWLIEHDPDNVPQKVTHHRKVKGSQEAHEAIRPTDITRASAQLKLELSSDEFALYVLIWKRAIASQCQPAKVRQTRILTRSGNINWQAKGQVIEFAGYSKYWNNLSTDVELPIVQVNQPLTLTQAAHEQKQTQPPPRYSEPKLVQVMERQGIGRPSTYAPTIQTLKDRQYVEVLKSVLQPTALGLEVDRFLSDALPDLVRSEFTAQMEGSLDAIAEGEQNWQHYLTNWNAAYFQPALLQAERVLPQYLSPTPRSEKPVERSKTRCPNCQKPLAKIKSAKLKKKYFLKCVEECTDVVLFWSEYSKRWEIPQAKSAAQTASKLTEVPCPVCQKLLEQYSYQKDGQTKLLLRCSDAKARRETKHKDVVYFQTEKGWWSPKFGELKVEMLRDR
ncbi:type I DNA topoisomerase [Leptolyngbya sp. NIES-2104]|uniref:type I DNA topoisomerase n=1 Tax=Leptolyngbya sp. NIES-2104 TaxID=1552121 RepID=UPI0006EC7AF7|nr:type I DNA topoisomerase [Leptolyngbya sp. NIES-2104]GAP94673.1 DNA topoisomerase I [Leptolyngbya sp. NIES-2104]